MKRPAYTLTGKDGDNILPSPKGLSLGVSNDKNVKLKGLNPIAKRNSQNSIAGRRSVS